MSSSATSASSVAERAAAMKVAKCVSLSSTHEFVPIAVETLGPLNASALTFLTALGKRLFQTTGDPRETSCLLQRISVCVQRFNSLSLRATFGTLLADDL